ncbi:MAG: DUF6519 domain-containing protein, partial [Methylobacter sp.]|nr:DUF6519 domain-containing protein [Methylobacter sp.]
MSGDYSRVRFDPSIDIAGVLMQQGRVQLDSDWNEWVAALDRRLRAESVDIFGVNPIPGIPGVAVVSPQTPEAFKINPDGGGSITIGRGRMYVDGLLAENHRYSTPENDDFGAAEFDPVLAELRGKDPLPYDKQPYFPNPPTLPANGSYLAYLEVWQREVTYHQLPGIVENAVGVDTTTRLQTVWQVRLLVNTSGADCTTPDDEIPIWKGIINPSAGRLSIQAVDVKNDTDPCELPPGGGYRGLENQLYRIEIHDGGALGAAKFKWSRENASVESNVAEIISSTKLKLASLGRDTVLRFNTGDWVEILDDRRELGGENGDPLKRRGEMRKITVDDAKQTISFSPALPADLIPPLGGTDTLATRHMRVKRWDQKGTVRDSNNNVIADLDAAGSSGLIPVPAAGVWVVLENGIQVQFSLDPSGDKFRCGDYWVSAARTADASVEKFTQAPPRGIHRHYARLAMLTFPLPDNIDTELPDCRVHWPPDCGGCCTYTVGDGKKSRGHFNSIQDAVKALPTEGGRICVLAGTHYANVELQERLNIHISGCGLQTIIFPEEGRKKEAIFQIDGCIGIQLRDLTLVAETGAAIQVLDTDSTKRASREIAVEQNHIIACTHAMDITSKSSNLFTNAIRIVGNEIAMLNTEEGESVIYTAADNVLIEDNLIVVVPHSGKALSDDPDSLY